MNENQGYLFFNQMQHAVLSVVKTEYLIASYF